MVWLYFSVILKGELVEILCKCCFQFVEGIGVVVDVVFLFGGYFCKGYVMVVGNEYWVIVVVMIVVWWLDQLIGCDVFKDFFMFVGLYQDQCGVELGGVWLGSVVGVKFGLCVVYGLYEVVFVWGFGLVGGIDVWCVVQFVDCDVVVIGQYWQVCCLYCCMCFDVGIVDEGGFGFGRFGQVYFVGVGYLNVMWSQYGVEFFQFVGIMGGDQNFGFGQFFYIVVFCVVISVVMLFLVRFSNWFILGCEKVVFLVDIWILIRWFVLVMMKLLFVLVLLFLVQFRFNSG